MSAFPPTAAFEMEMRDEWYGRMSHWVCVYFCLSLPVLFLKGTAAVFAFLLSGCRGERSRHRGSGENTLCLYIYGLRESSDKVARP